MTFDCPHLGCAKEYKCKRDMIAHALAMHKIVLSDADVQRAASDRTICGWPAPKCSRSDDVH